MFFGELPTSDRGPRARNPISGKSKNDTKGHKILKLQKNIQKNTKKVCFLVIFWRKISKHQKKDENPKIASTVPPTNVTKNDQKRPKNTQNYMFFIKIHRSTGAVPPKNTLKNMCF